VCYTNPAAPYLGYVWMCNLFDRGVRPGSIRPVDVGVPALESDQRCLFRTVDLLRGIEDEAEAEALISPVLKMIFQYSEFHFRRQERIMTAVGFPGADAHRREHARFLRWLDELELECAVRADPQTARQLWEDLSAWLCHHMLLQDVAVRPFLTNLSEVERLARDGATQCLVSVERSPRPPRQRRDFGPYAASALVT
jgi:hemerythrin